MTAAEIAAQAWRPIESAPKNIYVLAYFPDATEQERILIAGLLEFQGDPDPAEWWEISADAHPNPIDVTPTHWMPLPPPPVSPLASNKEGA